MYEYIPMKFHFDYRESDGRFVHYYAEAVTEERKDFKVAHAGEEDFFMNDYMIFSLISAMERGSLIDGMTLEELQDAYYCSSDEDLTSDIGTLL